MLRPRSQTCTKTLHSPNPSRFTQQEKSMAIDPQQKVRTCPWQVAGSWHLTGAIQGTRLGSHCWGPGCPWGDLAQPGRERCCQSTCHQPSQQQPGHIHGAWVALACVLALPGSLRSPPGQTSKRPQPSSRLFQLFIFFLSSVLANISLSFGLSELSNNCSQMKRNKDSVPFLLPPTSRKKVCKEEL